MKDTNLKDNHQFKFERRADTLLYKQMAQLFISSIQQEKRARNDSIAEAKTL